MEEKIEHRTGAERISEYISLLWHWAWLLGLCAVLAGGVAYWVSIRQTPVYEASALVEVDAAPTSQSITQTTLTASEQLAATYATEMIASPVLQETARRLKLPTFPVSAIVQVTPIPNTQLLTLTVQDTNMLRVATLTATMVQVFADQIQADQAARYAGYLKSLQVEMSNLNDQIQKTAGQLAALGNGNQDPVQQQLLQSTLTQYRTSYATLFQSSEQIKLAEAQSSSGIILKQPPVVPTTPVKPKPLQNTLLATLAGLMLAVGAVFLIDFLDNTIRDPQEITRRWGVPVLGTIVKYEHEDNTLITALQPRSPIAEAFRSLRTNLNFASFDSQTHTILVTSPSPEDGKTTVAANLANVIAQSGRKVVVVDVDLRKPRLHKVFQMNNHVGLTDQFLHPEAHFNGCIKQTGIPGLDILTSGSLPPNPAELLGSEKMTAILNQLSKMFDFIILDAPPLLVVTDALVLASRVGGVILVIKPSITKRGALKSVFDQMNQVKANVMGVVMNNVNIASRSGYYQYSGYYYSKKYEKGYHHYDAEDNASQMLQDKDTASEKPQDKVEKSHRVRTVGKSIQEKSSD